MLRTLTTSLAALLLATPVAAFSQDLPSYAQSADVAPGDQQLRGRITNFDGGYQLTVRDERGFIDNVALHPGTIINPTGLTLAPGMTVSILGYNAGDAFAANEIDTPYSFEAGVPYYSGHPWNYYDSGFSLAFFFGSPGWWHGNDFHGGYTYYGGARYYNDVHIRNVYNYGGGSFQGRTYVAPADRGGYYHGAPHAQPYAPIVHDHDYAGGHPPAPYAGQQHDPSYGRPSAPYAGQQHDPSYGRPSAPYAGQPNSSYDHSRAPYAGPPQSSTYQHSPSHYGGPPQSATYSHPQSHDGGRPQGNYDAHTFSHPEARPPSHSESRPQSHSEDHPQSHDGGQGHDHSHGGGHGRF